MALSCVRCLESMSYIQYSSRTLHGYERLRTAPGNVTTSSTLLRAVGHAAVDVRAGCLLHGYSWLCSMSDVYTDT